MFLFSFIFLSLVSKSSVFWEGWSQDFLKQKQPASSKSWKCPDSSFSVLLYRQVTLLLLPRGLGRAAGTCCALGAWLPSGAGEAKPRWTGQAPEKATSWLPSLGVPSVLFCLPATAILTVPLDGDHVCGSGHGFVGDSCESSGK